MTDNAPIPANMPAPPSGYRLTLIEVTSVLVVTFRKSKTLVGTIDEIEAFYRRVRTHNLCAGWWGFPAGLIWNPMAMRSNKKAMANIRGLAASGAVAANWYPDPTGRHGVRYWDGTAWTDRVSDLATDPLGSPGA